MGDLRCRHAVDLSSFPLCQLFPDNGLLSSAIILISDYLIAVMDLSFTRLPNLSQNSLL